MPFRVISWIVSLVAAKSWIGNTVPLWRNNQEKPQRQRLRRGCTEKGPFYLSFLVGWLRLKLFGNLNLAFAFSLTSGGKVCLA